MSSPRSQVSSLFARLLSFAACRGTSRACAIRAIVAFLTDTRGGATALSAGAVTVMMLGETALIVDHQWLIGQRDVLKSAADAAGIAATYRLRAVSGEGSSDEALCQDLDSVARRYVLLNLRQLGLARFERAREMLDIDLSIDRADNTVTVIASADMGGTLFSRYLPLLGNYSGPSEIEVASRTQCSGGVIEVVLALDVTGSMAAKVDPRGEDGASNLRMPVAIAAAKALVSGLHGCDDSDVATGIVPWDKTVRVSDPERWEHERWVDTSAFTAASTRAGHETWAGCLMDRPHSRSALGDSAGLSLALPSETAGRFPAYLYPDTHLLDPAIYDAMRDQVVSAFTPNGLGDVLDAEAVRDVLVRHSDNLWGVEVQPSAVLIGGPNFHCTRAPMLSITGDRAAVESRLDALYDPTRDNNGLYGGVTAPHLGVTWARRILAPIWRPVWGGATHPVDAADKVTKALVLLTDGLNGASPDLLAELPGDVSVSFAPDDAELESGCNPSSTTMRCTVRSRGRVGCGAKRNGYSSRFTALGRFGKGRAEDGYAVNGVDFANAPSPSEARKRLNALLAQSRASSRMPRGSMSTRSPFSVPVLRCPGRGRTSSSFVRVIRRPRRRRNVRSSISVVPIWSR